MKKQVSTLPNAKEVKESAHDPTALVILGDLAVEHVFANQYKYKPKWFDRLWLAIATLKDAIDSKVGVNSAVAELALLLLKPEEIELFFSRAEAAGLDNEPSEKEAEAWAWGSDLAKTTKWFVAFVVLAILAVLAFATVTFGLESPSSRATIVFLCLGSAFLAVATLVLGVGLYRHYVARGYVSWGDRGYPDAEVEREKRYYQVRGLYAYTVGVVFLAASVALALIVGKQLLQTVVVDHTILRLTLLTSTATGLILFSWGAWPIVRNVVTRGEIDRQLGKAKYSTSPRLLLTLLPILTGTLSLVINWLFR